MADHTVENGRLVGVELIEPAGITFLVAGLAGGGDDPFSAFDFRGVGEKEGIVPAVRIVAVCTVAVGDWSVN